MAARNKRKQQRQQPQQGNRNASQQPRKPSSGTGSNLPSSERTFVGHKYGTLKQDGSYSPSWNFAEQEPTEEQQQQFTSPLVERVGSVKQQPPSEDDIALDYVEEDEPEWENESYDTEPTFAGRYINDTAPQQQPSPEYIQSFQQHNPLTTYDPRPSMNNYLLMLHHVEQLWGNMMQINEIASYEQDDMLHGMLRASQGSFDPITDHLNRMYQYLQEQTHG